MKRSISGLLLIVGLSSALLAGERFVRDNTKEVVVDTKTNLMWQDNSDAKTVTKNWQDAIDYCENLTLGGYSDWYLPNFNQLWGLADRSRYNPAIDPVFQNISDDYYWTSTTYVAYTYSAWTVDFFGGKGLSAFDGKSDTYYVRCVRDFDSE